MMKPHLLFITFLTDGFQALQHQKKECVKDYVEKYTSFDYTR